MTKVHKGLWINERITGQQWQLQLGEQQQLLLQRSPQVITRMMPSPSPSIMRHTAAAAAAHWRHTRSTLVVITTHRVHMSKKSGPLKWLKNGFCSGFESCCCDTAPPVCAATSGGVLTWGSMVTACVVVVAAFVQICPVSDSAMEMCGARSRRANAAARVNVAHVCIP